MAATTDHDLSNLFPEASKETILYIFPGGKSSHAIIDHPRNESRVKDITRLVKNSTTGEVSSEVWRGLELSWKIPPEDLKLGFRLGRNPSCEIVVPQLNPETQRPIERLHRVHVRIHFNPKTGVLLLAADNKDGTKVSPPGANNMMILRPLSSSRTVLDSVTDVLIANFYLLTLIIPWSHDENRSRQHLEYLATKLPLLEIQNPMLPPRGNSLITADGKYKIWTELGAGAGGNVRLLVHDNTGDFVAGKFSPTADQRSNQIQREVEVLRNLKHPNIVSFIEEIDLLGQQILVTEYSSYGHLASRQVESWSSLWKLAAIRQLCSGLKYIHKEGIIHRDIKPGNILLMNVSMVSSVTRDPILLKYCDFGLATDTSSPMQRAGTRGFMAPELHRVSPDDMTRFHYSVDIWSLGVTFLWIQNTLQLWPGRANDTQEYYASDDWIQRIQRLCEAIEPSTIRTLLSKMLQPNPKDRWEAESCYEYMDSLFRILHGSTSTADPVKVEASTVAAAEETADPSETSEGADDHEDLGTDAISSTDQRHVPRKRQRSTEVISTRRYYNNPDRAQWVMDDDSAEQARLLRAEIEEMAIEEGQESFGDALCF
ncbi:Obscurin [Orbilia brochopaga]|nr:Obscurin [Drechslerella brochopaga]